MTYSNNCGRSRSTGNRLWSVGPRLARRPLEVPDLAQAELDPHLEILFQRRLALGARGPDAARRQDRRRAGDPAPEHGHFPTRGDRAAPDASPASRRWPSSMRACSGSCRPRPKELEIASRHKSEFLASMSHELRTPLNAVIGFSEVLLDRMFGELNERQDEYLRDIWNSGKHLLELLNEILDLSKVEAGQMVLEPSTFSVDSALEYALAMVRERAAPHAITVTVEVADDVERGRRRRAAVQAGGAQPASPTPSSSPPTAAACRIRAYREGTDARGHGHRHRHRGAARGPGTDLRVLPAGPPGRSEGGGHRPRTDAVATHRRAVRRADVA